MANAYEQIVALRDEKDARKRGYRFEQALREILPWSARPPIAVVGESEQLDAFFEWNCWHFIVESKAKRAVINRGSHDWEDFELKVRKRQGACIGLFCSLFAVADSLATAAADLNRQGICTLVIAGPAWDELEGDPIPFDILIRHMVWRARSQFVPIPQSPVEIRKWAYDLSQTRTELVSACRDLSATFLRRHRYPKHDAIYVTRELDRSIQSAATNLYPSRLATTRKQRRAHDLTYTQQREIPYQLYLIRDTSGAGKTTLAINIALANEQFLGCAKAALEPNIDDLSPLWRNGDIPALLQRLVAVDRPIVYFVDSLDEAKGSPQKKREVSSLMRFVGELNTAASAIGLLAFPILVGFTVRDDYWREWESIFEGSRSKSIINRFSTFLADELAIAVEKYTSAFHFFLTGPLTDEGKAVLATPFNLQVFAEAFEYAGPVSPLDFLDRNVLSIFFDKRCDNIIRRQIPGLSALELMRIAGKLAMECVKRRSGALAKRELIECINDCNPLLAPVAEQIILALRSDHILRQDAIRLDSMGFRHVKFIEYLVAYHIVEKLSATAAPENLETDTATVFESGLVSMFKVHEYIRHITRTYFSPLEAAIEKFYAQSAGFMGPFVRNLRSAVARGAKSSKDDLDLVLKNLDESDPSLAWEAFFVLCAKNNAQPTNVLLTTFELTWTINNGREDRWKMLEKMARRGHLLSEPVFVRIVDSISPKEWEVFLGMCLRRNLRDEFLQVWNSGGGPAAHDQLKNLPAADWRTVLYLLDCLLKGKRFVLGSIS